MLVIRQRNIVADNQHFDVVTQATGFLGGEAKVKAIAGIVFDDQQTARFAGHRLNGGQHRINARGGKRSPHTAAVSIPLPINPTWAGSWPEPPPEMMATLLLLRSRRTTTRIAGSLSRRARLFHGLATIVPSITSSTRRVR
jgi:hypothetical protein